MIKDVRKVTVRHNGRIVGYLARPEEGIGFQYEQAWRRDNVEYRNEKLL